jgi:preprotein translocase subunit SecD
MKLRIALFVVVALLAGCDQLLGESKSIRFKATAPILKQDETIIFARLREHTSALSPSYTLTQANGQAVVEAKDAPPDATIEYLLSHRGILEVKSDNGQTWFSQKDIVDAVASFDDQQRVVLKLNLSPAAGARVARVSADSAGALVSVEFDGETLTTARVTAPIPDGSLQLPVDKTPDEASLMATILRTGALSFAAESVQVRARP